MAYHAANVAVSKSGIHMANESGQGFTIDCAEFAHKYTRPQWFEMGKIFGLDDASVLSLVFALDMYERLHDKHFYA